MSTLEWVFSGIGVLFISLIIGYFMNKRSKARKNVVSSSKLSTKGDIQIGDKANNVSTSESKNVIEKSSIRGSGDIHVGDS